MVKCVLLCAALAAPLSAQIPSPEDLETKSKREIVQEGLEMREIRESAARDVGDALSKIDGISKIRKGGIANDVVLRGFQGGNLNLLIDGARIYGACPGHMDPSAFHIDFAEVESVQVTKGAFDIASQGSLGGVVNVVRKRPVAGFRFNPSLQLGSFGAFNPSLTGSYGNERLEVSAGYSYRQSAPFRDGLDRRFTEIANYRPQSFGDDAFRIHTGWGAVRFSPAANQSGELSYTHQDGSNTLYPYLQMDSPYDIADRLAANYEFRPGGAVRKVRAQSYYTAVRHWMTDEKRTSSTGARDVFSMATFAHTRVLGARTDVEFARGFTAGFEAYQRNWDAVNSMRSQMMNTDQNAVPNVNTTVAGAYLDYSLSVTDRFRIGAGARLDSGAMYVRGAGVNLNLFRAYKGVDQLRNHDLNPSANARLTFGLTNSLELFAGLASTVRLPDAQERYFNQKRMGSDWVGNPELSPTRNTETNLGLNFRRRGFFLKPLVFYSNLSDMIVIHNQARRSMQPGVMNTMARSYENVDARIYGGEITSGLSIGSRWLVSSGLALSRGAKNPAPALGIFNTNLPEMAPLKGHASLRYGRRLWFAEVEGLAASAQRRVDLDLQELPTPGYATANIRAGIHAGRVTVTAGIENLFDRYYLDHLSFQRDPYRSGTRVPEPGRTVFLNLGYSL